MPNTQLLIIDAQNDFCDMPAFGYNPALPIPGAYQDFLRLAGLITQAGTAISSVTVTLDSHHIIDLAHNLCWRDQDGDIPLSFTQVTAADLSAGVYRPAANFSDSRSLSYLSSYLCELELLGRTLTLWPAHCEIGSRGHNVNDEILEALGHWEMHNPKANPVNFIHKGENIWTESYSALKAVIPYPGDPSTELNRDFLDSLAKSEQLLIAGQASSHCVRETIEDILRFSHADIKNKLVILMDCMSPVSRFETAAQQFYSHLQSQGIRLTTSDEILPELLANNPIV